MGPGAQPDQPPHMDTSTGNPRLTLLGLLCVGFGAYSLLGAVFDGVASSFVHLGTWGAIDTTVGDAGQFVMALLGGVIAGWGAMMMALAGEWSPATAPVIRRALIVGMGVWFVLDSTGSVLTGGAANLLPNALFLALAVWAARR